MRPKTDGSNAVTCTKTVNTMCNLIRNMVNIQTSANFFIRILRSRNKALPPGPWREEIRTGMLYHVISCCSRPARFVSRSPEILRATARSSAACSATITTRRRPRVTAV